MTTQQHILACIDGSAVTESVCDYATWYASRLGLPVGLLNVVEVPASTRHSLAGTTGIGRQQGLSDKLTQIDAERSKIANDYSKALTEDAESYIKDKANVRVNVYRRRGKNCYLLSNFLKSRIALSLWDNTEQIIKMAVSMSVAISKP